MPSQFSDAGIEDDFPTFSTRKVLFIYLGKSIIPSPFLN
jgi:hypothetical protein